MTSFGFFRAIRAFFVFGLFFFGGLLILAKFVIEELRSEGRYRQQFGANWPAEYEKVFGAGSLAHAHAQIAVAVGAPIAVGVILFWVFQKNQPRKRRRSPAERR